jgi:VanZ family protein
MTDRATGNRPRRSGVAALATLAGLAVAAQLWGLYRVAGPPSPGWFPHADKLQHAVGFALPVALLLVALGLHRAAADLLPSTSTTAAVVGAFAAHGVLSEVVQHTLYTSRTGDPADVLADWTGVAVGVLAARAVLRRTARRTARPPRPGAAAPERSRAGTS